MFALGSGTWGRWRGLVGEFPRVLGGLQTVAGNVQLDDDTVMHQAVDGRSGGHRVLEDLLPA